MKKQRKRAKNTRLPKHITPLGYNIQLQPDLENFTFQGIETIKLENAKKTKSLTLHSKELEIETAHITLSKEKTKDKLFGKISYNEKSDTVTFSFKNYIPKKIELTIHFKGILNDKMHGFYRSKYHVGGREHHIATTQFEATDARRAFPCFDEPAHKAIFNVSIIALKDHTVISNTLPISVKEHESMYKIVEFSPTPKMSTYLLAFIVGDFEYLEKKTSRDIIVRVYTTPGKKHQAKFALDCAVKVLEFYEKYFDIPYPLETLDMVAIPDFSVGAMENWGAITYRETAILVDENHSSLLNKQWVALVIAHEIAHQWFGNLVTMQWWTHLWLNEGFATYIEYMAVDKLFPKWDIWTQFCNNELGVALRLDALMNTHPIEVIVHHPSEIGEIFDAVSYSKGASVIRMLAEYLGEKDFRDGLRYYLKKHSYKNTETVHLWQAFEKVSKKPVAKIMQNWTGKSGYPVVKSEIIKNKLSLTQNRFFASPASKAKSKDATIWHVPIIAGTDKKNNQKILLTEKGAQISLADSPNKWIKINVGESGFFRTAYSKELLDKLKTPVMHKVLPASDRLGIIRDLFALAEAGTIPTTNTLEFLPNYKNENEYTVWSELANGLMQLGQTLANSPLKENLNSLVISLFSPLVEYLGWNKKDSDSHADVLLRSLAISYAGTAGDKKIISEAQKKFALTLKQKDKHISPDIRDAVYRTIASAGGKKEYDILIKKYKEETLQEERNRIGGSLGKFKDPKLLKTTCEFAISKDVRIQDTVGVLSSVGANPYGRDVWWNFVRKNWKLLVSRYGGGGFTLSRLIKGISGSAEEKHLKSFKKFFATHDAPGAKRAIEQVIEKLESNIIWRKRDEKIIKEFFLKSNH